MAACRHCSAALDPATGRHIDDEGQVMDYREDLIQCRPPSDPKQAEYIAKVLGERGIVTAPIKPVRYQGFDII